MSRRLTRVFATAVAALTLIQAAAAPAAAAPCWRAPVSGWVVDPFRAPACPYCAGNRGLEYRVGTSATVRAVAAGTVAYSGAIGGVRYVVVRHANGWRTTYGKLTSTTLRRGDRVAARTIVGRASREAYFGLRVGEVYRDPARYLGRRIGVPRLVPIDGSPRRPPPPPRWHCTG